MLGLSSKLSWQNNRQIFFGWGLLSFCWSRSFDTVGNGYPGNLQTDLASWRKLKLNKLPSAISYSCTFVGSTPRKKAAYFIQMYSYARRPLPVAEAMPLLYWTIGDSYRQTVAVAAAADASKKGSSSYPVESYCFLLAEVSFIPSVAVEAKVGTQVVVEATATLGRYFFSPFFIFELLLLCVFDTCKLLY